MAIKEVKIGTTNHQIAEATITEDSVYPISSGAVYAAIEELNAQIGSLTQDADHPIDGGNW